jgi:DNA-binding NtrC family response regulator
MTPQEISLLLVCDRCADIDNLLHHTRWRVCRAHSVAEARAMLNRAPVQVVLCQYALRDGTWLSVLNAAKECDPPASVIVLSKSDDHTWAEVVSKGAYDLLPFPSRAHELYSIIPMAWRHCLQREHSVAAVV